jgi:predicted metalloendopeptidase
VVDQFEATSSRPEIHHNGKLVLGESIGDLAGAKLAFKAYQMSRKGKGRSRPSTASPRSSSSSSPGASGAATRSARSPSA